MTNLDSMFKSRDIILPTKVHLVKAMVFPVVMYGCESWTVKKAERCGEVSGHRVLIKRGPGNRGPTECGTTHEATSGMSS